MARDANPQSEWKALNSALKQGLPQAALIRGQEAYFRQQAATAFKQAAQAAQVEVSSYDGRDPDFELQRALEDLAGGALFATERCVLLVDIDAHLKKIGKRDSGMTRALIACINRADPTLKVMVSSTSLRADHAVAKAIKKAGGHLATFRKFWDSPPPWERSANPASTELAIWLLGEARERKLRLQPAQAVLLIESVGNDLFALETELEKFAQNDASAVLKNLGLGAAGKPFQVADDLVSGRTASAMFGIENLFRSGFQQDNGKREVNGRAILALLMSPLLRSVRQCMVGAEALAAGASPQQAAERAGVSAAPMAQKSFQGHLQARPRDQWEGMFRDLCDLDARSKSGGVVDPNDLVLLALRWRKRPARKAQPARQHR